MFIVKNVLTTQDIRHLKTLIDREIKNHLCTSEEVPLYQSYNNMNEKFKKDVVLAKLAKIVTKKAAEFYSKRYNISQEWFNVCKKNSKFNFHQHYDVSLAAVFYLKNCENSGTIFNINNDVRFQCLNEDNSIFFFNPLMPHTIPEWNGKDRYSIAFNLVEKPKRVDKQT